MNKVILFYDPHFPIEGSRPDLDFFKNLDDVTLSDAHSLEANLDDGTVDCLVNLHGPYFPKKAWNAIYNHLAKGKGLVHIGGAPFRIPCYEDNGIWKMERAQTAYHQKLNIHEILPVRSEPITSIAHNPDIPLYADKESLFTIEDTYNFILHVTKSSSIESEMGSVGPMDAHIYPLLKGISKDGREIAAPSVLLENTKGTFAGGRWVFINQPVTESFWTHGAETLKNVTHFVRQGVTDIWLKTNYAMYEQGERPNITTQLQALGKIGTNWDITFTITKDNKDFYIDKASFETTGLMQSYSFIMPYDVEAGYYDISCHLVSSQGETRILHQGFWGMDRALLSQGSPLTYGRDYFEKDGRPFPIVGMTYMTSDVARYFLFLPNPHRWDKDMAQMKRAGINYIRTGIWTAWGNMMFIDGHMDENVIRSIDAFIHCAKKHDLHVTFNFFSFAPPTWGGENPYLDPRSVESQKRFITAVVSRHKDTTNIDWDLINEPTMFDQERAFEGPRSVHDSFDRESYQTWLQQRHETIQKLQERWNMTEQELPSFEAIEPPEPSEINFSYRDMITGKRGLKWLDYTLYTMEMHNKWAQDLSETIKEVAPGHLVTVGQDEALAGQRPSPFFYGDVVDYTSNHTWWLLDDLIWDGIFTKTPNKPNLIQETGIMYVEHPNGQARRSEEELRNILERKYAYAFSTGGAGAVQWLWNTNFYMNNINESNIGAIRADGTEKPETNVSYDFGSFINKTRDLFQGRKLEEVGVVFPYSNDFSNRSLAYETTTKLTRVLAYDMNMPFRGFGEYQLNIPSKDLPKLLVVPSPHNFTNQALKSILEMVEKRGITLLFTGPINLDAYWHESTRIDHVVGHTVNKNVRREEMMKINDTSIPVSFSGQRIGDTLKGCSSEDANNSVIEYSYGKGNIIWSPVPVELNDRNEPITALYKHAMDKADVNEHLIWHKGNVPGTYGRKLDFDHGSLFIFVSENGQNVYTEMEDPDTNVAYSFDLEAERTVMFTVDKKGQLSAVYRPEEVNVHVSVK